MSDPQLLTLILSAATIVIVAVSLAVSSQHFGRLFRVLMLGLGLISVCNAAFTLWRILA